MAALPVGVMAQVAFIENDRYGLWRAGEVAEDLGWESDHPDAPPIRVLKLADGQVITLTDPFGRGLITELP